MELMPYLTLFNGIIFLITRLLTKAFPPKKINGIYGYRTRQSIKSQKHWDFAQKHSTGIMIRGARILLIIGLLFPFLEIDHVLGTWIQIAILFAFLAYLIYHTERELKLLDSN